MEEESEKIGSLIKSLTHHNKKVIRQAADTLISIAPQLPQLTQRLDHLLGNMPEEKRWPVAYVLAHISSPSSSCLDVLKGTLDSKDPDIRWAVALLLVRLGKRDGRIVTLVLDLLKTGTPTQRRMALYCLRDMGLKDTASLQALQESLRDPDPLVRVAALTSLKSRPEIGKGEADFLLHLFLEDPDPRVRHVAALALAELDNLTDEMHAALMDASRSKEPQLKKAAQAALDLLQKKGPVPPAK